MGGFGQESAIPDLFLSVSFSPGSLVARHGRHESAEDGDGTFAPLDGGQGAVERGAARGGARVGGGVRGRLG